MAAFDSRLSQIVIRIVYDGPGMAGKTTNLNAMTALFTPARRSEVYTPATAHGRTLFFDYIQLEGGLIAGHRYRCELWTVPGQCVLRPRREFLLRHADVAVLVVDSRPEGVEAAKGMVDSYYHRLERAATRLVVQANKQDCQGAMPPERIREALKLPAATPVIGAEADKGKGVRETTLLAMRCAAVLLQPAVLKHGPESLGEDLSPPEAVYGQMKVLHLSALATRLPGEKSVGSTSSARPAAERATGENGATPPTSPEVSGPRAQPPTPAPERATGEPAPPTAVHLLRPRAERDAEARTHEKTATARPPRLPEPGSKSLQLWPPLKGRNTLARVPLATAKAVPPAAASSVNRLDGEPTIVYRAGDWLLRTTSSRQFKDQKAAYSALVQLARHCTLLTEHLPADTLLALQHGPAGSVLWSIMPIHASLGQQISRAELSGGTRASAQLRLALRHYAAASVAALQLATEQGFVLHVHPDHFAQLEDRWVYLSDEITPGRAIPHIARAWMTPVGQLSQAPAAFASYLEALEDQIAKRLRQQDVCSHRIIEQLGAYPADDDWTREAQLRVLHALGHCRPLSSAQR